MTRPAAQRGRLDLPDLDDRRWQDLVDEARALIPRYAPQWTDHNPSDLGITLIELFAWLVEGLIYKLNRVPEKNYIALLNLLGVTRHPQAPARTLLTFTVQPGTPVTMPSGTQAQTQPSEAEAPLVFETDTELHVAPAAPVIAVQVTKPSSGAGTYTDVTAAFIPPPPSGPKPSAPPLGGATLHVPAAKGSVQLCLGFDQQVAAPDLDLYIELTQSLPPGNQPEVLWAHSTGTATPSGWPAAVVPADRTTGLRRDGLVRITTPTSTAWTAQSPAAWKPEVAPGGPEITGSYRWLGVRVTNGSAAAIDLGVRLVLFNTVAATAALTAGRSAPEDVGHSDGTPFQILPLRNRPLFKRPGTDTPYDHLTVRVADQPWVLVDELPPGAGSSYRLDPVTGEISFGNHDPVSGAGRGSIPAAGSPITATYRYIAGGAAGNVAAGTISAITTPVSGVVAVRNPVPARGGADEEPIEETKRRAPELLRKSNRAVSAEDYEFLARETNPDIAIVRCLPPRVQDADNPSLWKKGDPWRFGALLRAPGNVNLIIVPDLGPEVARPEPSPALIQDVLRDLDRRRDLTARLNVTGPRYLPIKITVDARIFQRAINEGRIATADEAYGQIRQRVERFFHPVHGGPDGQGWQVGESVFLADVYQAIRPSEEIGYIASLTLQPQVPPYHNPPLGPGGTWQAAERPVLLPLNIEAPLVRTADYELICFGELQIPAHPPE